MWTAIPHNISMAKGHVDLMVGPEDFAQVLRFLDCSGIESKVVMKNVQAEIDQERVKESGGPFSGEDDYVVGRPGVASNRCF